MPLSFCRRHLYTARTRARRDLQAEPLDRKAADPVRHSEEVAPIARRASCCACSQPARGLKRVGSSELFAEAHRPRRPAIQVQPLCLALTYPISAQL
jgi:hypothetical protein